MLVYFDNCVYNRPFDDQSQSRIKEETKAVLELKNRVASGEIEIAWSYLNEFESERNPFNDIRLAALEWKQLATIHISPSLSILRQAYDLRDLGLKPIDSLHVASALEAKLDYFISTDDGILSKLKVYGNLTIRDPVAFLLSLKNL